MCTCNLLVSYKYPLLPARTHAAPLSHVTASHEPRAAPLTSKLAARGTDPLPEAPRAWRSLKHPGCKEISNRRQISFAGAKEGPEPPLRPAKAFGWAARGPLPRNPRPRRARVLGTPSARRFGGRGALWTHTSLIKDARALGRVSNVSPLADKHAHEYSCATTTTLNSLTTSNHGQESRLRAEQQRFRRRRPRVREGTADERRRPRGRLKPARLTPSVPTQKSSKCSSRSRSSARARARVLLYHGPFLIPAVAVDATSARLLDGGGRPTPSRRRAGGRVCSSWWPRQLAGVEGDAYDFAPSRPRGRRSSPPCRI